MKVCRKSCLFFLENSCLWFSGIFTVASGKLGALRLKVRLVEDRILPSLHYQPLIHLLVESVISPTEVSFTICPQPQTHPHLIWFIKPLLASDERKKRVGIVSWTEPSSHQVEDSSALTMLEEVTTVESRQDVAMTLVKIYLGQGLVVPFLDYLNTREVNHTSKIKGRPSECFKDHCQSEPFCVREMKFTVTCQLERFYFNFVPLTPIFAQNI